MNSVKDLGVRELAAVFHWILFGRYQGEIKEKFDEILSKGVMPLESVRESLDLVLYFLHRDDDKAVAAVCYVMEMLGEDVRIKIFSLMSKEELDKLVKTSPTLTEIVESFEPVALKCSNIFHEQGVKVLRAAGVSSADCGKKSARSILSFFFNRKKSQETGLDLMKWVA